MHELSIAQNLLSIVEQEMAKNRVNRLDEVKVQVGELTSVVPKALEFAFQALIQDTVFSEAKLVLETVPVKLCCTQCGTTYQPKSGQGSWLEWSCPECGQSQGQNIIQGRELQIEHIWAE